MFGIVLQPCLYWTVFASKMPTWHAILESFYWILHHCLLMVKYTALSNAKIGVRFLIIVLFCCPLLRFLGQGHILSILMLCWCFMDSSAHLCVSNNKSEVKSSQSSCWWLILLYHFSVLRILQYSLSLLLLYLLKMIASTAAEIVCSPSKPSINIVNNLGFPNIKLYKPTGVSVLLAWPC